MSLFVEKPWRLSQDCVAAMPAGMLGRVEGALLYHVARDYFRGYGEIIDAGAFLGSSSYCLAKGLEENGHVKAKSGRMHVYDLFEVWLEQETTEHFMASELKRIFGIDVADNESTFQIYVANLGSLARHIRVHSGDITKKQWGGRPIEVLFLDICKAKRIWRHVLKSFYPSLMPGISLVVHQDYHHPLLPFIHVVQERLSPYFEIVDERSNDSAVFLLKERIPDRVIDEVSSYDYDFYTEIKLMDLAIERLSGNNRHLKIAKCQLLRQNNRLAEARSLIEELKLEAENVQDDPSFAGYIGFVEGPLFRDEARVLEPPPGFSESAYLRSNPDVAAAVGAGRFETGFHHWLQFGRNESRISQSAAN